MLDVLEAGLDGGFFWDTNQWFARDWDRIRRFGDGRFLQAVLDSGVPPPTRDTRRLHALVADRYSPWNAH